MTDPRILPDEELARYEAAARKPFDPALPYPLRILALRDHIKAQAEQVDTLIREKEFFWREANREATRAEKAEAERDDAIRELEALARTHNAYCMSDDAEVALEKARADAAVQETARLSLLLSTAEQERDQFDTERLTAVQALARIEAVRTSWLCDPRDEKYALALDEALRAVTKDGGGST